jgi:signal transduction histidine kinase
MAGEARRRNGAALVVRLEDQIDELNGAAADLAALAGDRLRDAKLAGLAELAAGAGHEINNPLAVISGNAQRLLRAEPDPERADALRAVVRQADRISGILRDLMTFARPPKPQKQLVSVGDLISTVRDALSQPATDRGVSLELDPVPAGAWVEADPGQVRHALAAVVRNGIDAAGHGGWVRLGCDTTEDRVTFVVEDSGPGLEGRAAEHAFDPFFCGRSAGRSRGLGLPTAWQFARLNAGDLRHDPATGPTRFLLTLPRSSTTGLDLAGRRSA